MLVHSVCGYRSNIDGWNDGWTNKDYRARNLVKGVKREAFRGFSEWHVRATRQVLRVENTANGQAVALRVATSKLLDLFNAAGIAAGQLIPVPSSQTIAPGGDYTGARLARAVSGILQDVATTPVLYFDAPQPRAHDGGARRWQDVLPHLRGNTDGVRSPAILIDDVMTSGGHLRACARFLQARGIEVQHAFVVGRTVWQRPADMFSIPVEHLAL
ncbi:phosphoribosyltransferase [uncultured Sphingomonas sp.]|uniref:phosphoribosyltransferase n=1 Tax=uncultured Sphingomonas sp. TaxID=158754 RepID=UPI0025FC083A|nr:phosphoribosyltransferase [uncultured Sphingomonas sp.]